jgi:hypothetical protein
MTHFFSNCRIILLIIIVSFGASFSQVIDTPYVAGTWRAFRSAAVSYTFDDGCANQFTVAIPMFNAKRKLHR